MIIFSLFVYSIRIAQCKAHILQGIGHAGPVYQG
jgi:hypothetical protein